MAAVFAVTLMLAVCFVGIFVSDESKAEGEYTCQILVSEHGELTATAGGESYGTGATIEGLSEGDVITFSAEADVGFTFLKLDAEGSEVAPTIEDMTVTMGTGNAKIVGIFDVAPEPTYTITIATATGGSATATKMTDIKSGEAVDLKATPDAKYKLGKWNLEKSESDVRSKIIGDTVYVYGNITITPVFCEEGKAPFYLTFEYDESQGIATSKEDVVTEAGKTIEIGAIEAKGFKFFEWKIVSGEKCTIADSKSPATTVTMNDQCRIQAVFVPSTETEYKVNIGSPHSEISASPAGVVKAGTVVTLSIKNVEVGWLFTKFTVDNPACKLDGDKLTVNGDCNVSAEFREGVVITFDTQGGKEIAPLTVDRESIIGEEIKLPKAEKKDFIFKGWFTEAEGGEEISGMITENITVYAHWEKAVISENTAMIAGIAALAVFVISAIAMIAGFRHPIIYIIAVLAAVIAVVAAVFYFGWIKF